jgi:uncharacterized phage protein (TIGR01671 family)
MRREIKFRVWDNIDYMSNTYDLTEIQFGKIQFTKDCIVMQFTGLKDMNGTEIYEDDIVFNHAEEGRSNSNTIIWDMDRYVIEQLSAQDDEINGIGIYLELYLFNTDIEVIGNIYENPELIP